LPFQASSSEWVRLLVFSLRSDMRARNRSSSRSSASRNSSAGRGGERLSTLLRGNPQILLQLAIKDDVQSRVRRRHRLAPTVRGVSLSMHLALYRPFSCSETLTCGFDQSGGGAAEARDRQRRSRAAPTTVGKIGERAALVDPGDECLQCRCRKLDGLDARRPLRPRRPGNGVAPRRGQVPRAADALDDPVAGRAHPADRTLIARHSCGAGRQFAVSFFAP
jgi:hypothetical protein